MLYLVDRAVRRLLWNMKIYVFILLELIVGFTMIACQINAAVAIRQRLSEYENQYTKSGLSINAYTKDTNNFVNIGMPVTKEDYDFISEKYKDCFDISYISYGSIYGSNFETIPVVVMSEAAFQKMFGVSQNCPYVGADAKKILKNGTMKMGNASAVFAEDGIYINGEAYLFGEFDDSQNNLKIISFTSIAEYDWFVSDCIVVPITMQTALEEDGILVNCTLELIGKEEANVQKVYEGCEEVITFLAEEHDNYSYEGVNKIQEYEKRSTDLSNTLTLLSWVAKFSLILIVVGMIGVLLILLDRRKKDFMISFWVGADKWKLLLELLLEMFILCFAGGGISLVVSAVVAPALNNSQYTVSMSYEAVQLIMIMCFVIVFVTCMTAISCVKTKNQGFSTKEGKENDRDKKFKEGI